MQYDEQEEQLYAFNWEYLVKEFQQGIEIKNRKYKLKTYKHCFIGSEAVQWLVDHHWARSREEAVVVGNLLLSKYVSQF